MLGARAWIIGLAVGVAMAVTACSTSGDSATKDPVVESSTTVTTIVEPVAEVSGPIVGGKHGVPYNVMPVELSSKFDYTEEEYFVRGEAVAFVPTAPLGEDGAWSVAPGAAAPYATRIITRFPTDASSFNGTVVVEWSNVSAGRDADPEFGFLAPYLMSNGFGYVGVSAQATGVEGGTAVLTIPGVPPESLQPLKVWDPERYGSLSHPGDQYSYDVFTQVGQLVRTPGAIKALDGLDVSQVIAVGESQSAARMATYVNAVAPLASIYDAALIHGRGAGASAITADPAESMPKSVLLRADLDLPVLQFESETDVLRGFLRVRQPDSQNLVTWEVAGTAHADAMILDHGAASGRVWFDGPSSDFNEMCGPVNTGPQAEVLRAGFAGLYDWVLEGTRPPAAPPLETADDALVVDELGLAVGGIRTPAVDAPIAIVSGKQTEGSTVFCSLFGQTVAFTDAQLAQRYADHDAYVAEVTASAQGAQAAGFLLPEDSAAMITQARAAQVP